MTASEPSFHVGDRALYRFGPTDVEVEVIEEPGPATSRGVRPVHVLMFLTHTDPVDNTVPEDELRPLNSVA